MRKPSDYKAYNKRALIFTDKAKQRSKRHNRERSQVYQHWFIQSAGLWHSFFLLSRAMHAVRVEWSAQYGNNVSAEAAKVIPVILSYCLNHSKDGAFSRDEIMRYLNSLAYHHRLKDRKTINKLLASLCRLHFLNPLPNDLFFPTNRLRLFVSKYEQAYKAIVEAKNY